MTSQSRMQAAHAQELFASVISDIIARAKRGAPEPRF
jgi:hypothetical protein